MVTEEPVVTREHIAMAIRAGACIDALNLLYVGMPLGTIPAQYLEWFANRFPDTAEEIASAISKSIGAKTTIPLAMFGCNGTGSGRGYGYGDGDGDGYGYGYGYGDGYGYGYGYGNGDGYGYGDGYGNGDGYGDGDGYGVK